MSEKEIASDVLDCVGGIENVTANSMCMTRLRVTVANPSSINRKALDLVKGVLGTATRGVNGIEVVLRPQVVQKVFAEFSKLTGLNSSSDPNAGIRQHPSNLHIHIVPKEKSFGHNNNETSASNINDEATSDDVIEVDIPHTTGVSAGSLADIHTEEHDAAVMTESPGDKEPSTTANDTVSDSLDDDALELVRLLDEGIDTPQHKPSVKRRLLVLNGPNINMLGIREPQLYGKSGFSELLDLCKSTAENVGFVECRCYQSNHEGDLVDAIQDAFGVYDGIVINPGAYTHTSVALLDAVKAVSIPTIEVHISKVEDREDFRQISYIRYACIETITGMGIDGYRVAIEHLAQHLGM